MPANIQDLCDSLRQFRKTPLTQLANSLDKADELRFRFNRMTPEELEEKVDDEGRTASHLMHIKMKQNRLSFHKKWDKALPLLIERKEHILIRKVYDKAYSLFIGEKELREPLTKLNYQLRDENGVLPDEKEFFDDYLKVIDNRLSAKHFNQRYPLIKNEKAVSL